MCALCNPNNIVDHKDKNWVVRKYVSENLFDYFGSVEIAKIEHAGQVVSLDLELLLEALMARLGIPNAEVPY